MLGFSVLERADAVTEAGGGCELGRRVLRAHAERVTFV